MTEIVESKAKGKGKLPPWVKDLEGYFNEGLRQKILAGELRIQTTPDLAAYLSDLFDLVEDEAIKKKLLQLIAIKGSDVETKGDTSDLRLRLNAARILVGSKGTGKTMCLLWKAACASEIGDGVITLPSVHPYHCRMASRTVRVKKIDLFSAHWEWYSLWKCTFAVLHTAVLDIKHPTALSRLSDAIDDSKERDLYQLAREVVQARSKSYRYDPISPILIALMDTGWKKADFERVFQRCMDRLSADIDHPPVVMIIDSLDEALANADGDRIKTNGERKVWIAAQTGLIDALYNLKQTHGEVLRIYATVREEAYTRYKEDGVVAQAQIEGDFVIRLQRQYDYDSMVSIFESNVQLMADLGEPLFESSSNNFLMSFFGVNKYSHSYVWGFEEEPVKWLMRHTFNRPRELVWHGQNLSPAIQIARKRGSKSLSRDDVATHLNNTAVEIFDDYRAKLIPSWDERIYDSFSYFKSNVISRSEADEIDSSVRAYILRKSKSDDNANSEDVLVNAKKGLMYYLCSIGLVGYPVPRGDTVQSFDSHAPCRQVFLELGDEIMARPDVSYFVLHPCFSAKLLKQNLTKSKRDFYSTKFVVGQGLPCPEAISKVILRISVNTRDAAQALSIFCQKEGIEHLQSNDEINKTLKDSRTFFFCLLFAMVACHRNVVTVDEIADAASKLHVAGLISEKMGNVRSNRGGDNESQNKNDEVRDNVAPLPPNEYIKNNLNYADGSIPGCVRFFQAEIGKHIGTKLETAKTFDGRKFGLENIAYGQIEISMVG